MPFVLTVDQRGSRRGTDRVPGALAALAAVPTVLRFERTAGDEFQGVLDDPAVVVDVVRRLVRDGGWSIGIGAGPVQTPLPGSTRAGAGPAFIAARGAVEAAKRRPVRVAVRGAVAEPAADAQAVLTALAALVERRSDQAWEAIALVEGGRTQAQAATELGVTRQAVGQRLSAGLWEVEKDLRPTAARLLARAAG
ncbi:hypothetical protein [Modestobacter versicolor]|uniref:SatD family (SatD) n=1 Tax=Modestobacter versicolor TaxID=429133 RepID=A0A323VE56_9ACTN|nr:hypothetical protein [Modestobacter versicolor]MBB3674899.1 hypothetical protein [Modestobacter versicolor]PZA22935.1 hypothetical protein DMO24_02640 [Modestobacter versicolor]